MMRLQHGKVARPIEVGATVLLRNFSGKKWRFNGKTGRVVGGLEAREVGQGMPKVWTYRIETAHGLTLACHCQLVTLAPADAAQVAPGVVLQRQP
jgi:hypothetical protein